MGLATVHSRTIAAWQAEPVQVEVHLANGLPCLTLVGLADTEVREARERVRSALVHSGCDYPLNQRITVNLAPADLPKASSRFDLPIALGILAAQGLLDTTRLAEFEFAGELSLAGALRPVQGALALALGLQRGAIKAGAVGPEGGRRRLVLPAGSAEEAALVPGVEVYRATDLRQVVAAFQRDAAGPPLQRAQAPQGGVDAAVAIGAPAPCLRDIRGQPEGKRALEVAAAGFHSVLLVGPPGAGKSMLAQRLPGLLPPLTEEEALECAALLSLGRSGLVAQDLLAQWGRRPWRAPHHSCTQAALVGGGNPPRPGEISWADHGVLFLDELPEFSRHSLEALREPLETGQVLVSRAGRQARFPSRLLLIAAMNPCPCGWLGHRLPGAPACRCTPDAVQRYQGRLSGPLLDRIDLQLELPATPPGELLRPPEGDSSTAVAERVAQARRRQLDRQGCLNAKLEVDGLNRHAALGSTAQAFLQRAAERLALSGRSLNRVWRVARTVADLAGAESVELPHLAEALQLRRGLQHRQGT